MEFWFYNFLLLVYSSELSPSNDISNDASGDEDVLVSFIHIKNDGAVFTEALHRVLLIIFKQCFPSPDLYQQFAAR